MKLYYVIPEGKQPPLMTFLETLEQKQRKKLLMQFAFLISSPVIPREPFVKHFGIEKYKSLFELRARSKIMIRIIFNVREDGSVLLLMPFIKKQSRDTMTALDTSLKMLSQINDKQSAVKEMTEDFFIEVREFDNNN